MKRREEFQDADRGRKSNKDGGKGNTVRGKNKRGRKKKAREGGKEGGRQTKAGHTGVGKEGKDFRMQIRGERQSMEEKEIE